MSNQQVMYSELNLNKDPKKQQGKPKGTKSSISENEQDITYAELAFQSASQEHRGNDKQHTCKDFTSSPQKLLAATLGTTCLILMVTVIVMVTVVIPSSVMQEQNKSSLVRTAKVEKKNWTESLASCTSKKSNLFYIDDEKEMKFLRVLSRPSWIGVSRSGRDHPWLSVNGSAFNMKVQNSSSNESNCVWLSLSGFMAENCGSSLTYNCKHKF
ncbi:NKG2-A/NKG2-B type II integral membrane protein-like isoform X2 [Cavia porcellus]|uniref:NKG2-A/NKG2-B type II integral membrane protein-like isoform X2 n=1 Tax=Cavia porcellus TaxID=10141 RepID=UPI002FE3766E